MSQCQETATAEDLTQQLHELRLKIGLLPEEQQSKLRSLVDTAGRECGRLHLNCAALREAVEDLHLTTRYAEFEYQATWQEVQEARQRHGL